MAVKFFSTNCDDTGGQVPGSSIELKQVTKMNITAPHTTVIDRPYDNKFNKLPIEILFTEVAQGDILETLAEFDNGDETDFLENRFIMFDGAMKLKTQYQDLSELETNETSIYKFDTNNLCQLKSFKNVEVI